MLMINHACTIKTSINISKVQSSEDFRVEGQVGVQGGGVASYPPPLPDTPCPKQLLDLDAPLRL